jgi:hypothetical protein
LVSILRTFVSLRKCIHNTNILKIYTTKLWLATIFVAMGKFYTGCKYSTEKVVDVEENVLEAIEDLVSKKEAHLKKKEGYKNKTNEQIATNKKTSKFLRQELSL